MKFLSMMSIKSKKNQKNLEEVHERIPEYRVDSSRPHKFREKEKVNMPILSQLSILCCR